MSEWVDDEGYPTKAMLNKIERWDAAEGSYNELMKFIKPCWRYSYDGCWSETKHEEEGIEYSISTGEWSGNEEIVRSLQLNMFFWNLYWAVRHYDSYKVFNRSGGHYIFKVKDYN